MHLTKLSILVRSYNYVYSHIELYISSVIVIDLKNVIIKLEAFIKVCRVHVGAFQSKRKTIIRYKVNNLMPKKFSLKNQSFNQCITIKLCL